MNKDRPSGPSRDFLIVLFIIATLVLLAGAYFYYLTETAQIREQKYQDLASIGQLKAGQIHQWRKERLADAKVLARVPFFKKLLEEWLRDPSDQRIKADLVDSLEITREAYEYSECFVASPEGAILVYAGSHPAPLNVGEKKTIREAVSKGAPMLSQLYRNSLGVVTIDAVAPILDSQGRTIAVGVLRSGAEANLYPLINFWPTPSKSAETIMASRDGDEIVALNDFRHKPNTALSFRDPLTKTHLPAVQAVLGKVGIFEGKDYRDQEVLADLRVIPDSNWFVVSKVDASEILDEARYRGIATALFSFVLVLFLGSGAAWAYSRRKTTLYRDLYQLEKQQRAAQEIFRTTLHSIGDGVITTDTKGVIQQMNPMAERLTGWTGSDAKGRGLDAVLSLIDEESRELLQSPLQRVMQEKEVVGSTKPALLISKDGEERPITISWAPILDEGNSILGVALALQDQTERKRHEADLATSQLRYRLVVENSHDVIWTMDPTSVRFTFVSGAVERMFGYSPEEAVAMPLENWVVPESWPEAIEALRKLISGEQSKVVYEGKVYHKDGSILWCEIVASLWKNENDGEIQIIGVSRNVTERKESERRLEESEANLRSFFDAIPESLYLLKVDGAIIAANKSFADRYGNSVKSLVGRNFFDIIPQQYVDNRRRHIADALQTGRPRELFHERSGRYVRTIAYPVFNSEGVLDRLAFYGVDITDAKALEESLCSSEERYRTIVNLSPTGIFVSVDGRVVYANEKMVNILGCASNSDLIDQCAFDFVHPDYRALVTQRIAEMMETGASVPRLEEKFIRCDGTAIYVEVAAAPIQFEGKRGVIVIVNDITLRKQTEAALQESEERFRTAFLTSPDAVTLSRLTGSAQGFYVDVNQGFCDLTGYTREEVIGKSTLDLDLWPNSGDRAAFLSGLSERGEVHNLEALFCLKDGRTKIGLVSARIINLSGEPHVLAVTRDVDEWKKAEEALRVSEERFRQVAEVAGEWIWEVDEAGLYRYSSSAVEQVLGYTPEEVVDKRFFWEFLANPERPESEGTPLDVFRRAQMFKRFATPHIRKDGKMAIIETSGSPILDNDGAFRGYRGTNTDITEAVRSAESQKLLAAVVEHASESIVVTDTQGDIRYVNPAFEAITGYTKDEAMGLNPRILKSGKQDSRFYESLWKTITQGNVWQGHFVNKKKDGGRFEEDATISPLRDSKGEITNYVAVKRDITKEVSLQRQLAQSQKMEAIGTLAGGIAHDFNNILFGIIGYTELAMDDQPEGSRALQNLERALAASKRAGDMVQQILLFSRQGEYEKQLLDLTPIVKEGLKFLRGSIPTTIEIRPHIGTSLGKVEADPTQMHQVLMNLCTNAAHSMKDAQGVLTVELSSVTLDEDFGARSLSLKPGKYIRLIVSDTGHGISPDVIEHIFEPYFTTKKVGEGTGLGLSVVHGIVATHGGSITVYSVPGEGSTFKVFLPVVETAIEPNVDSTPESAPEGHGRILYVDDEQILAEMGEAMLRRLGYDVVSTTSSVEALEIFRSDPQQFDLLVTDLIMPKMTGSELGAKIIELRPDMPMILCTGFGHKFTEQEARERGFRAVINKPISKKEVGRTVREALERKD